MPLKALLFDKDGTLIHFNQTWHPAALSVMRMQTRGDEAALAKLAGALNYDLASASFLKGASFVAGTWADYGGPWAVALGVENNRHFERETNILLNRAGIAALAPVGNPLKTLQKLADLGLRLGVATNDVEFAAHAQCGALGLTNLLHYVAGCDSGHGAKPNPGMVLAFALALELPPQHIGMVGDSVHDMHAARDSGCVAIAVLTGPATREEIEPHADYILNSIDDLPAFVTAFNAAKHHAQDA